MQFILMAIMAVGIVAADQLTKYITVQSIPLFSSVPAIDGVFHFTFVQNTGAAFSSFEGMQWLFAVIFALFTAAVIWEFATGKMGFTTLERWCIAAVWAGGLGNMIDRVRLGYVVDMICTDFITFPVFNVADIFITCGCILLLVHLIFFNKGFWKDEKK
jgi:signal peptidase II